MGRITDEELERIKREADLEALVTGKGVRLMERGGDLVGLCPFHDDHEPSLVLDLAKNLWHCFGACGTGGSAIDWVMKTEGVSFRHAVELLRHGREKGNDGKSSAIVRNRTVPLLQSPVDMQADDRELLDQVVSYYHERLMTTPSALSYLEKRGIRDE